MNLAERVFVLLFMFFALSAFAISVASLTQAYFKISERSRSFTDELFAVRMLLKRLKMDGQTRRRIKECLTLMRPGMQLKGLLKSRLEQINEIYQQHRICTLYKYKKVTHTYLRRIYIYIY